MSLTQIAFCSDSIGSGEIGGFDYEGGGLGCYEELVADRLANFGTLGPLIGPGFRGVWRTTTEWARVGVWTQTVSTDAFDRALYGEGYRASGGSGTTNTWTVPGHWRPVVGFCVYWIDYAAGGAWQYSIDGGAWTAMGQTRLGDNLLKKFYVPTAVASTVAFRAFDGSGACGILLAGIEPFYTDPRTTGLNGLIVHDLGRSAGFLSALTQSGSGDRLAWFDAITLGTGSPPTNRPSLVVVGTFSNDVILTPASTTGWSTNLQTIHDRVTSYSTVAYLNAYEQGGTRLDGTDCTGTQQANYRAALKTVAATNSCNVLDIFDAWSAIGFPSYATANTQGFMYDTLHPSQAGHLDIATRVYGFLRGTVYATQYASITHAAKAGSSLAGGTDLLGGNPVVTVGVALLNAAPTLFSPAQIQQVAVPPLDNTATLFQPATVLRVSVPQLNAAPSLFSPAVTENVAAALLNAAPTIFTPTVAPGSVSAVVPLLSNPPTFFSPAVSAGAVTVTAIRLDGSPTFFAPVVTTGSISVALALLDNGPTFFSPTVAINSVIVVVPLLNAVATFFSATVTVGQIQIVVPLLSAVATLHPPRTAAVVADAMPIHVFFAEQREPRYLEQLAPRYRE